MRLTIRCAMLLAALAAGTAHAQEGPVPDPDWPCIQRRQPSLSVGQVWGGPPPDEAAEAHAADKDVKDLAHVIALRRTAMADAQTMIADFAGTHDEPALVGLFLAVFEQIQGQRNRVMAGITRYAHQQEALDARIKQRRQDFARLTEAEPPDFDAIDRVEEEIDWSTRIFQDRQQSLTYVCETPVILEQRIFALGRAIASHLPR
ncbi:hypothetical protein SAMN04489859_1003182 [Paracoccus alcaliphilus]|uniref:Uncharacterized protein n=1 Tax=Paracoccus alcaliphilus TaxID=34002 RepID=A0A1H8F6D5_9RHOB|nr:hypothetical protein [Paracoccus alcaliphilus]WCR20343.1 hypothetical protein JHW40_18930 [Paracoccus alcaliphilus]SEN27373.1 hypothetical protein SAMN04489859_1003182 [Paracoccus alcaliphilus]